MGEFWQTNMGSHFYQKQFPALVEAVNRLAKANEELCEAIREQNCLLRVESEQRYGADKQNQ